MNTANFSEYLQNPSLLYQISYEELKTLIVQYPYSQNLRYLIAQKSNMENNPDYEHFLRSASIISTDRVHLYHILKMQKTEAVIEDSFILEEETLELKDLNVLDLNQVPLEPVENAISDTALDLNTPSLQEEDSIFNTFPELSPESSSDLAVEESLVLEEKEEGIILPTLEEEEVAIANLLELEEETPITTIATEEDAIEQLIDDTASEIVGGAVVATSIADLLADDEAESEEIEEVSLTDLFETEIPQTPVAAVEETKLKFTPNVTSIHELLGEEDLPKRPSITKPLRPLDRRHFRGNKQTAYKTTSNTEQINDNTTASTVTTTTKPTPNEDKTEKHTIAFQAPSTTVSTTPALATTINENGLATIMSVNPGYDEEQIDAYANKSIEETADIASETYANLLVRQNQHAKAIQVYERLKLIFPEKSTFFAEQIESLEQKL